MMISAEQAAKDDKRAESHEQGGAESEFEPVNPSYTFLYIAFPVFDHDVVGHSIPNFRVFLFLFFFFSEENHVCATIET